METLAFAASKKDFLICTMFHMRGEIYQCSDSPKHDLKWMTLEEIIFDKEAFARMMNIECLACKKDDSLIYVHRGHHTAVDLHLHHLETGDC